MAGVAVDTVSLEVCHATPQRQLVLKIRVPAQASLHDAILASAICTHFPEIDLQRNPVGSYGRLRTLSERVREGDRIEIYRELPRDPKLARRERAQRTRRVR